MVPAGNSLPIQPASPERPSDRVRQTQRRMWPTARPAVPGLDYYAGWRIGESRDIDYLDYFESDGGNFTLAVGDLVAGNAGGEGSGGTSEPALLLSSLHAMVRSLDAGRQEYPGEPVSHSLGSLVDAIHQLFYEAALEGSYATLFLARYDPVERRLDYCNAGHEAPLLLRKSAGRRRTILLESGGPVIGVLRRSAYHQTSLRLQPGDILAAYTAGVAESRNRLGEEWGYGRLVGAIEAASDLPARDMVEGVLEEADAFGAAARRANDMTLWLGRLDEALTTNAPLEAETAEHVEPAALAA